MDKIKPYQDEAGRWRWAKYAENNERVAASGESFDSKSNAIRAAEREAEGTDAEVVVEEPDA